MEAKVKWVEERTFLGEAETSHTVVIGNQGETTPKRGPSPMELVLMGAGGCAMFDVVSILEKARQDVDDVEVRLSAERAETTPRVFTTIHMHFVVTGRGVSESTVKRAIDLSANKYCSATSMLAKTATITHSHEIIERSA